MSFLPTNYEIPKTGGNYLRLEKGDTKIRVMSSAIVGFEYWNMNNKPVRLEQYPESMPSDIRRDDEGNGRIKHFWAFVVWNYNEGKLQVAEITQKSIMQKMNAYISEPAWGDPKGYDLKITRRGDKLETKYEVVGMPKTDLTNEQAEAFATTKINLNALFSGGDPFSDQGEPTKSEEDKFNEEVDVANINV